MQESTYLATTLRLIVESGPISGQPQICCQYFILLVCLRYFPQWISDVVAEDSKKYSKYFSVNKFITDRLTFPTHSMLCCQGEGVEGECVGGEGEEGKGEGVEGVEGEGESEGEVR